MKANDRPLPQLIVVGGPSGAGKSTVARALATRLGYVFHDGDNHHSAKNRAKMNAGVPLTDDDRLPWLQKLASLAINSTEPTSSDQFVTSATTPCPQGVVIACSALRRCYRAILIDGRPPAECRVVMLRLSESTLARRLASRQGHFFNSCLLRSQLFTLELPSTSTNGQQQATSQIDADEPHLLVVDGERPVSAIIDTIIQELPIELTYVTI